MFRSFDAAQRVCMILETEEALAWWGWCSAYGVTSAELEQADGAANGASEQSSPSTEG